MFIGGAGKTDILPLPIEHRGKTTPWRPLLELQQASCEILLGPLDEALQWSTSGPRLLVPLTDQIKIRCCGGSYCPSCGQRQRLDDDYDYRRRRRRANANRGQSAFHAA